MILKDFQKDRRDILGFLKDFFTDFIEFWIIC